MHTPLPESTRQISLCLGLALLIRLGSTEAFGQQRIGSLKADRILYLGNSLTLHEWTTLVAKYARHS